MVTDQQPLQYDEVTLWEIYAALEKAGISQQQALDAVQNMQNSGILFRKRDPR